MSTIKNAPLLLAGIIAATLAADPAAAAVTVNDRGLGQVLLFPYYSVNAGNDTYLSITNTTNRGKAVKLRFRESRNGRQVYALNLYLSPYDVWTAAVISVNPNAGAQLLTRDTSCTVPAIRSNRFLDQLPDGTRYVSFGNTLYYGSNNDGGDDTSARTRDGFLEVIEMGELRAGIAATQVLEEVSHASATEIPNSSEPVDCGAVIANWNATSGAWGGAAGNRQMDIDRPTGGLYGSAQIINVANGTLHAYAAEAIEGFYSGTAAPGGLHTAPDSPKPDLADASNGSASVDSLVTDEQGNAIRSSWTQGTANAVSAVLMASAIDNDFDTESSIGAQSEWIVTFPTKSYYADLIGTALPPFLVSFPLTGLGCERIVRERWDREELPAVGIDNGDACVRFDGVPPPCDLPVQQLCGAATSSVFTGLSTSTAPSEIFGATAPFRSLPRTNQGLGLDRGHLRMAFTVNPFAPNVGRPPLMSREGHAYYGLPVIGFWSANYVNANAVPGALANYSGAVRHHRRVEIIVGGPRLP